MNDNKLIAEFMDLRSTGMSIYKESEYKYHTSWDWLMPVVAKCREESSAEDSDWEGIYYTLEYCDIDVTYKSVVEFIKTYNNER